MKIVVSAAVLRKEIETRKEKARQLRMDGLRKWDQKLRDYTAYVQKTLASGTADTKFKWPPGPPSGISEVFDDALRALAANTVSEVTMDSKEYNDLLNGLEQVISTSVAYLGSLDG